MYRLRQTFSDGGAGADVMQSVAAILTRRGDLSGNGMLDAADVDQLLAELASNQWTFDFDSDGGTAWNDIVTLLDEFFDTLPGDAGLDGLVDEAELSVLRQNWHATVGEHWRLGDFDGSGLVDEDDLMIVAANWQGVEPLDVEAFLLTVPEPGTLSLLGGAAAMLFGAFLARRR